ncbi:MAG: site-specific integrase [Proteobacteria bacterium]|nr:site-specific integrase [Pseudomonadota bacterium]
MLLPSHLKISRHGIFNFRIVLPAPIAIAIGQREIKRSLHTRCPIEAKGNAYELSARILPVIHRVRTIMTIDPNSIDPTKIKKLIVQGLTVDRKGTVRVDRMETSNDPKVMKQELKAFREEITEKMQNVRPPLNQEGLNLLEDIEGKPPRIKQSLKDAFSVYVQRFSAGGTEGSYNNTLNLFARLIGDENRMVHTITKGECQYVADALQLIRKNAQQLGVKIGTAKEIVKKPKRIPKKDRLSNSTINQHYQIIQQFFDWAIGSGRYTLPNPIEGIARLSVGDSRLSAEAFNDDELNKVFVAGEFEKAKRPHQFWVPLIGLFTGARANEIAMLRLQDLVKQDGIRCFAITHEPDADEPTRTKNRASRRKVPIHPRLLALGFDEYIKDLKSIKATRLFPYLPIDKKGKRDKNVSRDFNNGLLKRVRVHKPRTKVFHSFRDTCVAALAKGKLHEKYIAQWVGHSPRGMQSTSYLEKLPMDELSKLC